jgi:ubiquinone/menaquinone biosynthesis C-methylase UbiE
MSLGNFSQQANAYHQSRPAYPAALVNALLCDAGVQPGDAVADVGAGTGIFTRFLAERGLRVVAVEPNEDMRRQAEELPGVFWVKGTFEATTLPDASQRWVVAAQAFHWADPPRALPEMRRVLQPGCGFTVLWNNRQNEGSLIVQWTHAAIERHVPEFDELYRHRDWGETLRSTGEFTRVVVRDERHVVPMSCERFLALWKSHNRLTNIAGPKRFQAFYHELSAYLAANDVKTIDVPYLCKAWTAF